MDIKRLRNDIILIASLLIVAVVSLVCVLSTRRKDQFAKVYCQNDLVLNIDLSKKENKDYEIQGLKGMMTIHTEDGYICVSKSSCPHQDCVRMGRVNVSNRPIICVYNAVYIVIAGQSEFDVEV